MNEISPQLEALKRDILQLGNMVEQAIAQAINALIKYDRMLARAVIAADESIDRKEVDVEKQCLEILSAHRPSGGDLRFVVTVLKVNNDLERIGDLAVNIAETVAELVDCERFERVGGCDAMAKKSQAMLRDSLQALLQGDVKLARQVIAADDEVDEHQRTIQRRIEQAIDRLPENVRPLMQLDFVVRQLERVGDMATNIAEDVIYLVEGKIVRHLSGQQTHGRSAPGRI